MDSLVLTDCAYTYIRQCFRYIPVFYWLNSSKIGGIFRLDRATNTFPLLELIFTFANIKYIGEIMSGYDYNKELH